jgi:hypothetical protein
MSALVRRRKSRVTPCGFKHDMSPFFVGLAAAEFLPADPAIWLEAAGRIGMSVELVDGRLKMLWQNAETEPKNFLLGWLHGTPASEAAVCALLEMRMPA